MASSWHSILCITLLAGSASCQDARYDCLKTSCWCRDSFSADEIVVTKSIKYRTAFNHYTGKQQTFYLDMYAPPTLTKNVMHPGAIIIHGGGFSTGDHNGCSHGRDMDPFAQRARAFAQRGFVAVSIDYRCEGPTRNKDPLSWWRDPVADARGAAQFLRNKTVVDPNRIVAFGGSAGAVTVAHLIYTPLAAEEHGGELNCGISLSGALGRTVVEAGNVTASATNAPYIDFHGTADTVVPYDGATGDKPWMSAVATKKWLDDEEAVNELVAIPGEKHVPFESLYVEPYASTFFGFLLEKMKLSKLPCPPSPSPPSPSPAPSPRPSPLPGRCQAACEAACPSTKYAGSYDTCLICTRQTSSVVDACMPKERRTYCERVVLDVFSNQYI